MTIEQDEFELNDPTREVPSELELKALEWMDKNPHLMKMFMMFAMEKLSAQRRFGIGALTERVRWETPSTKEGEEEYKIPNNHRAYIARRLIRENQDLEPLIVTKRLKGTCAKEA